MTRKKIMQTSAITASALVTANFVYAVLVRWPQPDIGRAVERSFFEIAAIAVLCFFLSKSAKQ
jgi:hypothetical protein